MNILICDYDDITREKCKNYILRIARQNQLQVNVDTVETGDKLLLFKDTKYPKEDLIILDATLPGSSGFDTAADLRKDGFVCDIVFYTKDEVDAIRGYDVEALHYLIKDKTSEDKFVEVLRKAILRAQRRHVEIMSLSCAGVHRNIPIQDILFFSVENRITTVHYMNGNVVEKFEFYSSLSKIEEFLLGKGFERIHGSYLVSKKFVRENSIHLVKMIDGSVLPVGRTYMSKVRAW